ncbi:hypothetical protein NEOLEDRAFT_1142374 [Neolentinus lepideus HHB14362 ss-1]|uniref:Uncharacterized protein n=1 Tax=Neolentinus lepideus HHB14362 ss-1 TaxID=1314782 RepID=A0A165N5B8_9AGAM|nr:hypothetical protein NEOLEDRAFT_1142374 [Neolentinus lepideus HHB14362 ss-1]
MTPTQHRLVSRFRAIGVPASGLASVVSEPGWIYGICYSLTFKRSDYATCGSGGRLMSIWSPARVHLYKRIRDCVKMSDKDVVQIEDSFTLEGVV